jgi:hypothetical protein
MQDLTRLVENQKRSKRKRGAPVGNLNALKHGRYTREARARKPAPIPRARFEGIDDHINHIRAFMRHIYDLGADMQDLDQSLRLLNTYTLSAIALLRLINLREKSFSPDPAIANLESALLPLLSELDNGSH